MYQNRPYVNTHHFLDANIPESYFISSGGLTANTYPDLLGEYFLSDTHYKGRAVFLYMRTSNLTGNSYLLWNRTPNGVWNVGDNQTLLKTKGTSGPGGQAPSIGWNLFIRNKQGHGIEDESLRVSVNNGKKILG